MVSLPHDSDKTIFQIDNQLYFKNSENINENEGYYL